MGADNVLEATVVLPSGEIVTTNACQHPDLFYAIRGGGGSTFGVVTSVVMKAYPAPRTANHMFFMTSKHRNASSKFYDMAAFILSEFPRLKDGGMQGYFGFRSATQGGERVLRLNWGFNVYNKPNGTIEALFEPIKQRLDKETEGVTYFSRFSSSPMYAGARIPFSSEPFAAGFGWLGGWLLPRSALTNVTRLATALSIAGPSVDGPEVCSTQFVTFLNCLADSGDHTVYAHYWALFFSQWKSRS